MEIESLLKDLIKIESITPKDEGCFDLIEPFLKDLGFKCERIDYDNVENLYAVLGNEGPLMCFLGHTDVVPTCLLYTSPSPRDREKSRMPSSA